MPSLNLRKKKTGLTSHPKKPSLCLQGTDILLEFLHCFPLLAVSQAAQQHRSAPGHGSAVCSLHMHPAHPKTESRSLGTAHECLGAFPMQEQHSLHRCGPGLDLPHKSWELLECWIVSSSGDAHDESGLALRQKEKAPLECNCILNYFNCCCFLFLSQPS